MRDKFFRVIATSLLLVFLLSIFSFSPTATSKNEIFLTNRKENTLKSSKAWDLTGSPILIDDSDPSKNWSYTASHYDWCSGSGTWTDPYVIENVTIDGQGLGSCIEIANSSAYFIIRNCSLYNSDLNPYYAGIKLNYVDNGKIINTDCNNNFFGIALDSSNNNTLSGNTVNYNLEGIRLEDSNKNSFWGKNASHNSFRGIYLRY